MSDEKTVSPRLRLTLEIVKLAVIVATCLFLVWVNRNGSATERVPPPLEAPVPEAPVSIDGATLKGSPKAPVVLIEWSDYECPFCQKIETDVMRELDRLYFSVGRVQLAFFHRPLTKLHPNAAKAAEAADCAGRQGKFWQMHAALFDNAKRLDNVALHERARTLGLDEESFGSCLAEAASAKVNADSDKAERLGLTGTPAFLVGVRQPDGLVKVTTVIRGAKPLARFTAYIDSALEQAKSRSRMQ